MRRLFPMTALILILLPAISASSQQSTDFLAGRLFQIFVEAVPSFTPQADPSFGTLETGASQSFEQTLEPGTCYAWIAVGDSGLNDLDIAVVVNGMQVTGDNAPSDWPITQFCSAEAVAVRVDLTMANGSGLFGFQTFSRFFGGSDQIELQMNYLATVFASQQVPQSGVTRGSLAANGEQTFSLPLNAGQCYTIIGTGGAGVVDLDFFLNDADGQIVASDPTPGANPVVGVCPEANANFTLRVLMFGGAGEFGWQSFGASYQ